MEKTKTTTAPLGTVVVSLTGTAGEKFSEKKFGEDVREIDLIHQRDKIRPSIHLAYLKIFFDSVFHAIRCKKALIGNGVIAVTAHHHP